MGARDTFKEKTTGSKSELFSVRLPSGVFNEINTLADIKCAGSKKDRTQADFKRFLVLQGLWLIQKSEGETPDLNAIDYAATRDPKTYGDKLADIDFRLANLEQKMDRLLDAISKDIDNRNNKKWFK